MIDTPGIHKLRVRLEIRSDIERFLGSVVDLAKILDTEIAAVFLADEALLNAAALPVVQEVLLWTARERGTSTTLLSQAMSRQARHMERLLARIAERKAVPYSFTVNHHSTHLHTDDAPSSALWVGGRCLSCEPDLLPVCVIDTGDESSQRGIWLAARLCTKTQRPLKAYTLTSSPEPTPSSRAETESALNKQGINSLETEVIEDFSTWLKQIKRCFVLIIPESSYTQSQVETQPVQTAFPVLLV